MPISLSRKIAGDIIVNVTHVIRTSKENSYQFRAYRPGQYRHYAGHLKIDGDILGDIATFVKGKSSDNEKIAIQKIHAAFPEISGVGLVYPGYIEVAEPNMPESLKS